MENFLPIIDKREKKWKETKWILATSLPKFPVNIQPKLIHEYQKKNDDQSTKWTHLKDARSD